MGEKRRTRRKARFIVFLLLLLFLSGAALAAMWLFTTDNVIVVGNELYSDDQVREVVLSDRYSWSSLYVYLKFRFHRNEEVVPFVDSMEVSLKSPDTLEVTVYEKGLMGYIRRDTDGRYVYFDKDGFVIEISEEPTDTVPEITGVNAYGADVFDKLEIPEKQLRTLLTVNQGLSKYGLSCETVELTENSEIHLIFGGLTVDLGADRLLTEKITRLSEILPDLTARTGYLDLSTWTEETTDIVFTPNDITPASVVVAPEEEGGVEGEGEEAPEEEEAVE